MTPLQAKDARFERVRNLVRRRIRRKRDWSADVDCDFAEVGEAAAFALHLPNAIESHRNNGKTEVLGEQADATLERRHAAVFRVVDLAFGENEDAVAAVGGFTRKTETFAETRTLRQREDVK